MSSDKMRQVERHPKKQAAAIREGDQIFYNDSWLKIVRIQREGDQIFLYGASGFISAKPSDNFFVLDTSIVLGDVTGVLFLALFVLPVSIIWGVVISKAWEWFVVPVFDFNQMPVVLAAVIVLCFRALLPNRKSDELVPDSVKRAIMAAIVGPGLTFLYLLFLSRFM